MVGGVIMITKMTMTMMTMILMTMRMAMMTILFTDSPSPLAAPCRPLASKPGQASTIGNMIINMIIIVIVIMIVNIIIRRAGSHKSKLCLHWYHRKFLIIRITRIMCKINSGKDIGAGQSEFLRLVVTSFSRRHVLHNSAQPAVLFFILATWKRCDKKVYI